MKLPPRVFSTLFATVLLSACGSPGAQQPNAPAPASVVTVTETAQVDAAPQEATAVVSAGPYQAFNPSQVGGSCAIDAAGVTVTASSSASCGFAASIFNSLQGVAWGSTNNPNVTSLAQVAITAGSPATGQTYSLTCTAGSDQSSFRCVKSDVEDGMEIAYSAANGGAWPALGIRMNG